MHILMYTRAQVFEFGQTCMCVIGKVVILLIVNDALTENIAIVNCLTKLYFVQSYTEFGWKLVCDKTIVRMCMYIHMYICTYAVGQFRYLCTYIKQKDSLTQLSITSSQTSWRPGTF